MHRFRDDSKFSPKRYYSSPTDFLSSRVSSGHHVVTHGNGFLDLFIEDRGSQATLVLFHSALSPKVRTVPVFQGRGISLAANMNLVSVADPSVALGNIDLAWHLGNRGTGPLREVLSPLLHHAVEALGGHRSILVGASGGGYAAVNFGQDFPDSIVLAINPRLDMGARPAAKIGDYLRICHGAMSATPQRRIRHAFVTERLADCFAAGLPFDLLLFQNTGDRIYRDYQAGPFIEQLGNDPRLFVRMEYTAEGHRPIPGETIRQILEPLGSLSDTLGAIRKAGFAAPKKTLTN